MHIKVPFLAVLIITVFQLALYAIQNNEYSEKELNEILTIQQEDITEIQMVNLSGHLRYTKDPKQINAIYDYFNQFQYKRLRNDQTAFMPNKTMMLQIYAGDEVNFIVPYEKEAFINHRVYQIKNGKLKQDALLDIYESLPEKHANDE